MLGLHWMFSPASQAFLSSSLPFVLNPNPCHESGKHFTSELDSGHLFSQNYSMFVDIQIDRQLVFSYRSLRDCKTWKGLYVSVIYIFRKTHHHFKCLIVVEKLMDVYKCFEGRNVSWVITNIECIDIDALSKK